MLSKGKRYDLCLRQTWFLLLHAQNAKRHKLVRNATGTNRPKQKKPRTPSNRIRYAKTRKELPMMPGDIAWAKGEQKWRQIRRKHSFPKGSWVAVDGSGAYVTATTRAELDKKISVKKWFSPYYEQIGVPVAPVMMRKAVGSIKNRRAISHSGRVAFGTGEPNLTTSISGQMRNQPTVKSPLLYDSLNFATGSPSPTC